MPPVMAAASTADKITVTFNTSDLGAGVEDRAYDAHTSIGDVHMGVRRVLKKAGVKMGVTYLHIRNGTEGFIPSPESTLDQLFETYAVSTERRVLAVTVSEKLFSG